MAHCTDRYLSMRSSSRFARNTDRSASVWSPWTTTGDCDLEKLLTLMLLPALGQFLAAIIVCCPFECRKLDHALFMDGYSGSRRDGWTVSQITRAKWSSREMIALLTDGMTLLQPGLAYIAINQRGGCRLWMWSRMQSLCNNKVHMTRNMYGLADQ